MPNEPKKVPPEVLKLISDAWDDVLDSQVEIQEAQAKCELAKTKHARALRDALRKLGVPKSWNVNMSDGSVFDPFAPR